MRAIWCAVSAVAAFAVQTAVGSPYYGNYTSTSTVFVTSGQCVPVTSNIYTTFTPAPTPVATVNLSVTEPVLITKTLFKTATTRDRGIENGCRY